MTSLLIIAAMIAVLLGATAYGLLNASAGLMSQIDRATTETRLEEAARGVLANIVTVPSASAPTYAVPSPDSLTSPNIPSWIMMNATNSRGVPFLYCPYTNVTGVTGQTITVPSGTYGVTSTTIYTGSKNFITVSAARPANASSALAIIVAPGEKASSAGDCTTISATGTVTGSSVRVITEADVMARDSVMAARGAQLYVGTSASGDGTGRNTSNRAAFDVAMTYSNQYRPQYLRMDLASGTYTTTEAIFSQAYDSNRPKVSTRNSAIDFRGAGTGSSILQTGTSFDARFLSSVYMQDLSVTPAGGNLNIGFYMNYTGSFITNNVDLQYFDMYSGSSLYALGTTSLYGVTGDSIYLYPSAKLYADSTFNLPSGANFYGGYLRSFAGNLIFGSNSAVVVNSTSGSCGHYPYGAGNYYFMGTYTASATSGSATLACAHVTNHFYFSGATITGIRANMTGTFGRVVLDRGTSFVSTASNTPAQYLAGDQGSEVYITNSTLGSVGTSSLRPSTSTLNLQSSGTTYGSGTWILGGGTNGGWTASNLTVQTSGNSCLYGNADNFYIGTDTAIYDGTYSRSLGARGFEAWLIANRSNWYCNR